MHVASILTNQTKYFRAAWQGFNMAQAALETSHLIVGWLDCGLSSEAQIQDLWICDKDVCPTALVLRN